MQAPSNQSSASGYDNPWYNASTNDITKINRKIVELRNFNAAHPPSRGSVQEMINQLAKEIQKY